MKRGLLIGLVLAAAAFILVYESYRSDLGVARARIASGSSIAQTACGPLEYAISGEGPPVLVVHGSGGGFDQGLEFGAPLVKRGFQVIAPSRFGYLRTPVPADV